MVVELFAFVFFKVALALVPRCAFKIESMNPDTFCEFWRVFTVYSGTIRDENVSWSSDVYVLLNCI
jgi:hypothetical protein